MKMIDFNANDCVVTTPEADTVMKSSEITSAYWSGLMFSVGKEPEATRSISTFLLDAAPGTDTIPLLSAS